MSERDLRWNPRLIFGLCVLTAGVLFTLDNFGLVDARPILRWWPVIVIAIGVSKLLGIGTSRNVVWGATFSFFGAVWLGSNLHVFDVRVWDLWPVLLIVLGASFLMRGMQPRRAAGQGDTSDEVHALAFMSGVERNIDSKSFRGGDLSALMGGVEIDLRDAQFENGRAVIEVFAMWGGIDLMVPADCKLSMEGFAMMGAIEDTTKRKAEPKQVLVIRGFVMMGGVEIKN